MNMYEDLRISIAKSIDNIPNIKLFLRHENPSLQTILKTGGCSFKHNESLCLLESYLVKHISTHIKDYTLNVKIFCIF